MAAIKTSVCEAKGSRADRPLWQWKITRHREVIALGFSPTREEAEAQLERAKTAAAARLAREHEVYGGRRRR